MLSSMFMLSLAVPILGDAPTDSYPRAELLVEPAEFAKIRGEFVVLDARIKAKFDKGHAADAIWVDHESWSKKFGAKQDPEEWSRLIGELGIDNKTKVVIYDDALQKDAARIWWILRYWGVKDARLVNGGWHALEKRSPDLVSTKSAQPTARRFKITSPEASKFADRQKVLDLLKDKKVQIIDARSEKEHCGEDILKNKKSGAIPGALNLEWTEALDQSTQKFKSAPELMKLFKEAGIDVTRPTVTHCQSGGRAAVMAFTLELMGAKEVANYYRGWSEWGNTEDSPIVRPKKK